MDLNYLLILLMVAFSYLVGNILFSLISPNQYTKLNLFLKLAISWVSGNFLVIVILHYLAFFNLLELVTRSNFFVVFFITLLVFIILNYRKWSQFSKTDLPIFLWLILLFTFLSPLLQHSLFSPFNAWDAVAIWGLKAKVLLNNPAILNNPFFTDPYYQFSHQDYPLGLPLLINFYYRLVSSVNDQAVQFYLLIFYITILFTYLGALLHWFKTKLNPILLGLIMVSFATIPNFIIYSHNGYADIPLSSIFTVTAFLFIDSYNNLKLDKYIFILLIAVTAVFIKTEGYLLFFSTLVFSSVILVWKRKKLLLVNKYQIITNLAFLLLALVIVFIWENYKFSIKIEGEFNQIIFRNPIPELKIILHTYLNELINTNRYSLTLIPAILLYLYQLSYLAFNRQWPKLIPNLLVMFQLCAYTFIYLITPNPLLWQLTSFERVFLHILPAIILIIFYNSYQIWFKHKY